MLNLFVWGCGFGSCAVSWIGMCRVVSHPQATWRERVVAATLASGSAGGAMCCLAKALGFF